MTETLVSGTTWEYSASYQMNTQTTGFRWYLKSLLPCALDESSLSIGGVKRLSYKGTPRAISRVVGYREGGGGDHRGGGGENVRGSIAFI